MLRVFKYGSEVLRKKAEPVIQFDDELRKFIKDMKETMIQYNGAGLAAPQVGVLKQLFVAGIPENYEDENSPIQWYVFINPKITYYSKEVETINEGCLSFPDLFFPVTRSSRVTVEFQDEFGVKNVMDAEGFLARVIQHETDHLNGILYIDRISPLKRSLLKNKLKRFQSV
ncbi:MAG: peptide deformylase [bacterium]|nr:peptide deformylase [bacterium]